MTSLSQHPTAANPHLRRKGEAANGLKSIFHNLTLTIFSLSYSGAQMVYRVHWNASFSLLNIPYGLMPRIG
jgi:hypothetical protein